VAASDDRREAAHLLEKLLAVFSYIQWNFGILGAALD